MLEGPSRYFRILNRLELRSAVVSGRAGHLYAPDEEGLGVSALYNGHMSIFRRLDTVRYKVDESARYTMDFREG